LGVVATKGHIVATVRKQSRRAEQAAVAVTGDQQLAIRLNQQPLRKVAAGRDVDRQTAAVSPCCIEITVNGMRCGAGDRQHAY